MNLRNLVGLLALVLVVNMTACSKRSVGIRTQPKRNPPTVPVTPGGDRVDPAAARSPLHEVEYNPLLLGALNDKGLVENDNCIRWVKISQNGVEKGQYLEIAAKSCPGSTAVLADSDVLLRLTIAKDSSDPTLFLLSSDNGAEVAAIRDLQTGAYSLEGICELDPVAYNRGWSENCAVWVEGNVYGPYPIWEY